MDTDVVVHVLAISYFHVLNPSALWIAFGTGKNFIYIAIHEIAMALGPEKVKALPLFHALSGSDTTSFFYGKGKVSFWDTWNAFPQVIDALNILSSQPDIEQVTDEQLSLIERFIILLYDRTSSVQNVNEVRRRCFCKNPGSPESIPPTSAALRQHILRAVYQAGHVWSQSLVAAPDLPCPSDWGWEKGEPWMPFWTTLGQAQDTLYELIKCGCKKACRGNCKCDKANLKCTALCNCEGHCFKDQE